MDKTYADIVQFLKFVRTHLIALVAIMVVVTGGFLVVTKVFVPMKYKSFTVVTIPTRYFQQPAVEDIIPSVQDPGEMRSLREGLVTGALDRTFTEAMRVKYNLFADATADANKYEINMQKLKSQFEVISLDLTSFQVGFISADAQTAYEVANDTQKAIIEHLTTERSRKLIDLRNNLLAKVDSLGFNVNQAGDPLSTSRPEALQNELQQVRSIMASLGARYTSEHPMMQKYQAREKLIVNWLASHNIAASAKTTAQSHKDIQGMSSSSVLDTERYTGLLKRVDILNIVIDYENSDSQNLVLVKQQPVIPLEPMSPKMKVVFFWGLLSSLLVCAVYLAVKSQMELFAATVSRMDSRLKVDFIEEDKTAAKKPTTTSDLDQI